MNEALRFFRTYELWIYLVLTFAAILYLRKFVLSWQEFRSSVFGLERENAQGRLNQAVAALLLLIILITTEFVLVTFVAPLAPESSPLLTPTVDILATPTITLPAESAGDPVDGESEGTPEPTPTLDARLGSCTAGQSEITAPIPGDQITGAVDIVGSASITSFGFYKLEVARADQETAWRTIQAGRNPVLNGVLVTGWDASTLQSGDYLLRLVVTDNKGNALPDCRVPIRIINTP